jgi:hypothetical protein
VLETIALIFASITDVGKAKENCAERIPDFFGGRSRRDFSGAVFFRFGVFGTFV